MPKFFRFLSASLCLLAVCAFAQDEIPTRISAQNRSGELPFSVTVGTGIEHVDATSGDLMVTLPILITPGRGMEYNFSLVYDARFWVAAPRGGDHPFELWNIEQRGYLPQFTNGLWATNMPRVSYASYTKICNTNDPDAPNHVFPGHVVGVGSYLYHDVSGAKHPLSVSYEEAECEIGSYLINNNRGPALSGAGIVATLSSGGGGILDAIHFPDGNLNMGNTGVGSEQISVSVNGPGFATHIGLPIHQDVYGNAKDETPYATGTDTLGRNLLTRSDSANQTIFQVFDASGVQRSYTINYVDLSINTSFNMASIYGGLVREFAGTRKAISSFVLPNGKSYQFQYDNYGYITEIDFPTGAVVRYTWANDGPPDRVRYVTSRTVIVNGQSSTWNFSRGTGSSDECSPFPAGAGCRKFVMTDPLQNQTVYIRNDIGGGNPNITRARVYQGSAAGTPLREYTIDYLTDANEGSAVSLPTSIVTSLENGLVSKKEFTYDVATFDFYQCVMDQPFFCTQDNSLVLNIPVSTSRGNVLTEKEYDWGQGAPGALLRTTTNEYLHDANSNYANANIVSKITRQTVTDGSGAMVAKTEYTYDNSTQTGPYLGSPTKVSHWRNTDGAMLATTLSYDPFGNITSVTDPLQNQTTWSYDDIWATGSSNCLPSGNIHAYVTQKTDALGHRIKITRYPCTGQVQAHQDENDLLAGRAGITYSYDLMNRPLSVNSPDGGQTTNCYSDISGSSCDNGGVPFKVVGTKKITSALNLVTTTVSDGLGRTIQSQLNSDPQGTVFTDTSFDLLGRAVSVSNPYRNTSDLTYGITQTQFDALNRTTQVTKQDGSVSTITYSGNCVTTTDEAGKQRKACSDALGRLSGVWEDPAGLNYETDYQYDVLGNLLRVDQKGSAPTDSTQWRTRLFTYNSLSQLLTANNPESGLITYFYDADGNLTQKVMPSPNQVGTAQHTISYCYDVLNRVTGKAYSWQNCQSGQLPQGTAAVTYKYDEHPNGIGHLTSLTDQAGSASYTYDLMDRVSTEGRTIAGVTKNMSYTYNLDGSVATITYPSGAVITYTRDSVGRMVSAVDTTNSANPVNYVTGATYNAPGMLTGSTYGQNGSFTGILSQFSFNNRLQPVNLWSSSPTRTLMNLIYDFHVGNGDNGNVYAVTNNRDTSRSQTFTYDPLNRLLSAQNAGTDCSLILPDGHTEYWGNNYVYDAWGNLKQKQVTKCAAENLNTAVNANNRLQSYDYDSAGNMTRDNNNMSYVFDAENRISSTSTGFSYTYDADGNRVQKTNTNVNPATGTLYWYMSPGIVAESDLSGNLQSEYVFFDGERVARKDFPGNAVSYYFSDHLKTASVITDAVGTIKSESDYYPWGGELQFANGDSNHYKFTGKERDAETGLDYFGARHYSNGLGRFITPDWAATPVAVPYADLTDPQSLNQYSYVRNIPTSKFDADGHECPPCDEKQFFMDAVELFAHQNPGAVAAEVAPLVASATPALAALPALLLAAPSAGGMILATTLPPVEVNPDCLGGDCASFYIPPPPVDQGQNQQSQTQLYLGQARGLGEDKSWSDIANERARTNGGTAHEVDFSNSLKQDLGPGQKNTVEIQYTGSRADDFKAANKAAGFKSKPEGYTWHHVPNYNAKTNTGTMQLVKTDAHRKHHHGGVRQWEKAHNKKYRSMMLEERLGREKGSYAC